nr:hypothetical protein [Tanacetum cinerariifolium]
MIEIKYSSALFGGTRALEQETQDLDMENKHKKNLKASYGVLDNVSLFKTPGVTYDAVMLRVFPITLTRAAKRPLSNLKKSISLNKKVMKHHTRLGKGTMNRQFLDSQGPIPCITPAQALTAIQTMADHNQKWYNGSSSRNIDSGDNSEGISAIVNKLDRLGRNMKKLKENVQAIQEGCQLCGGAHLDKECPLNEEVKSVEEVKYSEFRRSSPSNNGAKYRVGPPGYHTRIDNRPTFREKRPCLEELITQIKQLTKEIHTKAASEIPNSSVGQYKAIYANDEAPIDNTSSNGTDKLHGVSFISDVDERMAQEEEDLGASVNVIPKSMFKHLKLANLKKTGMLVEMADMTKRAPIGIVENFLVKIDKFLFPSDCVWEWCGGGGEGWKVEELVGKRLAGKTGRSATVHAILNGEDKIFGIFALLVPQVNEDYHVELLQVIMEDSNITMEEYIRLEEEKAHMRGKVYNWETTTMVRSGLAKARGVTSMPRNRPRLGLKA